MAATVEVQQFPVLSIAQKRIAEDSFSLLNLDAIALAGPALLFQLDTTIVVPPGWNGEVDPYGNLLLEPD